MTTNDCVECIDLGKVLLREKFICHIAAALLVGKSDQPEDWIAHQALLYTDALIDVLDTPKEPS